MSVTENYLRSTVLQHQQLSLTFKYKVKKVKYFTIQGKGIVKHVYDIYNTSLPRKQNLSRFRVKGIKAFRMAQYRKSIIRVVIESSVKMEGAFRIFNNRLVLFLPNLQERFVQPKTLKYKVKKRASKKYSYNTKRKHKVIILDAGHGGKDIGASSKHVLEKDLALSMTLKLKRILQNMGYRVFLTRSRDKSMTLKQRTDYAHAKKASLFVSIHANAAPIKRTKGVRYEGLEVFYLSLKNSRRIKNNRAVYRGKKVYTKHAYKKMVSPCKFRQSRKLAKLVHASIISHVSRRYKIHDKGIKRKDFWVLLATKTPSILVETGYLSNKNELKKLRNTKYQIRLMEGVARGINGYFGYY